MLESERLGLVWRREGRHFSKIEGGTESDIQESILLL